MTIWIELFKFSFPLLLQNKSTVAVLSAAVVLSLSIPAGIIAYTSNENTNRLIETQNTTAARAEKQIDRMTNEQQATTAEIRRLARLIAPDEANRLTRLTRPPGPYEPPNGQT